jgi:DNA-binding NarL/FixJ family response regulator
MIRVVICDDQAIIREGLEMLLKLEQDFDVAGLAQDGHEAVEMVTATSPDLVLMDLKMPVMNGVEATRRILAQHPGTRVLVLTTYDDDEWVLDAIRAGASGYLLKDTPREKVIEAIRGTVEGRAFLDPSIAGRLLEQVASQQVERGTKIAERLTEREGDVLRLMARGLSNSEIAARLHLSEGTVRNYVSAVLAKLDVSDRTQAAIIAIRHGLDR